VFVIVFLGGLYAREEKQARPPQPEEREKEKIKRRNRVPESWSLGQTNEPFEQDTKRRIGQYVGTGTAPLMKK